MIIQLSIMGIAAIWYISMQIKRRRAEFGNTEFDLATVNEKFSMAADTRESLNAMEQLVTDIDICNATAQKVLHLQWLGEDEETHEYDLYLDGQNTATECMREIAVREIFDLRGSLSYQIERLAEITRQPGCNTVRKRTRKHKIGGVDDIEKAVYEMRQGHGD